MGSPSACSAVLLSVSGGQPCRLHPHSIHHMLTKACLLPAWFTLLNKVHQFSISSACRLACANVPDLEAVRAACGSAWAPVFGNSSQHLHFDPDAATTEPTQCSTQCSKQIFNLLACTADEAHEQVRTAEVAAT